MISTLGFLATGNQELADALRRTLVALAANQTPRGLVPGLAHDPADRGSSDTTPLFLFGLALYRKSTEQPGWQTWSAAMYLYAAECVGQERTPFFSQVRGTGIEPEVC